MNRMAIEQLPQEIRDSYEIHEWKHATAILAADFPNEFADIVRILQGFRLKRSHVCLPGGNITLISQHFNRQFRDAGWHEKKFNTKIVVDGREMNSPTHLVDCVKSEIALEIEWNNKDPFFDRDLNNFRLLFELRAASVGIIITKSDALIPTLRGLRIFGKYGMTTTWMSKLLPRINGGGGGGCPLLVFGIKPERYDLDVNDNEMANMLTAYRRIKGDLPTRLRPFLSVHARNLLMTMNGGAQAFINELNHAIDAALENPPRLPQVDEAEIAEAEDDEED